MAWVNCVTEIQKASGLTDMTDDEAEAILDSIFAAKERIQKNRSSMSDDAATKAAAEEVALRAKMAAQIERRNRAMNLIKRKRRRGRYTTTPDAGGTKGAIMGLRASLGGVNRLTDSSKASVAANASGLRDRYIGGLTSDLEAAGVFRAVRSNRHDKAWARELHELNKEDGSPGISGNKTALTIAKIIKKYQDAAVAGMNREGAWIGDLDGFTAGQTHDSRLIQKAGQDAWVATMKKRLDFDKTFEDVSDPTKFLKGVYNALITGVHLTHDGGVGFKDAAFKGPGNLAKKLSKERVLHFKTPEDWVEYHKEFGSGTLIQSVLKSLDHAARDTALMAEFGTNPRGDMEADIEWLQQTYRNRDTDLVKQLEVEKKRLSNKMDILDGTASRPVHVLHAEIQSGWSAIQAMAKLGAATLSTITDIAFKSGELNYQGIGLGRSYLNGLTSYFGGLTPIEQRTVARELAVGFDGMAGMIAARFDAGDTTPGRMAKLQNTFFKYTGMTYVTDIQRQGAAQMMAANLAEYRGKPLSEMPAELGPLLRSYGIDEATWQMLSKVDPLKAHGREYMTPRMALDLPAADIEARLRAAGELGDKSSRTMIDRAVNAERERLGMKLQSFFSDRSRSAIIEPGVNERALMLQGTRPGTGMGTATRLFWQFKAFPMAVMGKVWGREISGHANGGAAAGIGGMIHMIVMSTLLGYLAGTMKEIAKGRTPREADDPRTWAAAFMQGGGTGIMGDFLFGEYNRFGSSMIGTMGGPTVSTIEQFGKVWAKMIRGEDPSYDAFNLVKGNTPFINMFYTKVAVDYLILFQVSEILSPGFLARYEKRLQKDTGQQLMFKP